MASASASKKTNLSKLAVKKIASAVKKTPAKPIVAKPTQKTSKVKLSVVTKPVSIGGEDLGVGMPAPAFKLKATNIGEVSLAKMKGKAFVLYFYPKDETSGCTAEACNFRTAMPNFSKMGITVIGISKDNLTSHERFKKKFDLNFPLAYDENGKTCVDYGVWGERSLYGRKYMGIERSTFLIDSKGIIRAIWRGVSVPGHVDQVKKAAAAL